MKVLDIFILLVLFLLLASGIYFLWQYLPGEPMEFEEFKLGNSVTENLVSNIQFYPNMRYRDRTITYSISVSCDISKRNDAKRAFAFISANTILEFSESQNGEIDILCSDIAPKPEEKGHFVAGEGGPSEVINTTNYAVILSGKVSLYRSTKECVRPNVAIHEILHALGFDHNNNKNSIMYPVTECDQELDNYIVESINRLYSVLSLPDLAIEKVKAEKSGRYLNFEISIGNFGLRDSNNARLNIYAADELIKEYDLESIDIGTKKILTVENLIIPRDTEVLFFEVDFNSDELSKKNNRAEVRLRAV